MRFATLATADGPRAAAFLNDRYVDLHRTDTNLPNSVRGILGNGEKALQGAKQAAESPNAVAIDAGTATFLSPIADPPKIVCIGLNYRDHAEESGVPIPKEPIMFSKFNSALLGHEQAIVLPRVSQEVDYEAELVIVIGKRGRHVSASDAMQYVAGYAVGHDVSARDWQLKKDGGQWLAGKTFDTFAPVGPHLVTKEEIADPHQLPIRFRLNGETMQDSNTNQMIFRTEALVEYLSQVFTLEVGDLIFTGTPPGVGFARNPKVFLNDGDVAEVEIEGLGVLRNTVRAE